MVTKNPHFIRIEGHVFDKRNIKEIEDLNITRERYKESFEDVPKNMNTIVYLKGDYGSTRLYLETDIEDTLDLVGLGGLKNA
jgi:hypothetical protein